MPKQVLLVDDVSMFLEIQKDFLKGSMISVLCARDGVEALAIVNRMRPDLVIMDLYMPGLNGAECCAAIKRTPELSNTPVIMATGAAKKEDLDICRAAGCDALLTKPFDRSLYLDTVRRYIPELDRREKRTPLVTRVRFQAYRVVMSGMTRDVSRGGLSITTDYSLDVGTEVSVAFSLPGEPETVIQAKGVIRWKNDSPAGRNDNPSAFGIEFTAFGEGSAAALRRYLASRE